MDDSKKERLLKAHRTALANNPEVYVADMPRIQKTVVKHLKDCGFRRATRRRCGSLVDNFVQAIFDTQDHRPLFHVDAVLPFCWNRPRDWDKNYIRYEWGHLRSRNQNEDALQIENLAILSARCNQHIQSSMDISEVVEWLSGSVIVGRIQTVLDKRNQLFASREWKYLLIELERFR